MAAKNYYEILGVSKTASQDEIKSAYRKLVKQYHPDLHPNDPACAEKFKEINEANEVLSDEKRRKQYDFELEHPNMGGFGGFSGGSAGGGFSGFGGFEDIFGDIFGSFGGGSRTRAQAKSQGEDITVEISLSFLDAAKGCTKDITYTRNQPCASCKGTGAKNGTAYKTCEKCGGTGQVQYVNNSGFFRSVSVRACDECHGTGKKIIDTCPTARARDTCVPPPRLRSISPRARIPAAICASAATARRAGTGGEAGDPIVVFKVEDSKIFRRKNFDLYVDLPISYKTAALGGKVEVPTIDDTFTYTIPEGTPSRQDLLRAGQGHTGGARFGRSLYRRQRGNSRKAHARAEKAHRGTGRKSGRETMRKDEALQRQSASHVRQKPILTSA